MFNTDDDDDIFTGKEHTPLRLDAFELSPSEKIEKIWRNNAYLRYGYDRRLPKRFSKKSC